MALLTATCVLLLSVLTFCANSPPYTCTDAIVPLSVTNITTIVPPFPYPFPDGYAATAFSNAATLRDAPNTAPATTTLSATFNISIRYCTPKSTSSKKSSLQLLSHGIGFNKSYWDFHLPTKPDDHQYSYTYAATQQGYSTLSYDRLGIGLSSLADPYTEVQAPVELALLAALTTAVRNGKLPIVPKPKKILHVGHSWGSELSNALAGAFPTLSDGVVLTGYSHLFNYELEFLTNTACHLASVSQPERFQNFSTGYLTWSDKFDNQYSFFSYPYFDPAVLTYAESTKFPFTVGEFISQAALNFSAPDFTGPVLYLAAEHDLIFCGGDCKGLFGEESDARLAFPKAKSWERYIQPNVGHGINLHFNASGAYSVIQNWAGKHGF
jgi:pimeloyl-ACP methyl ester carboxylesterase